MTATITIKKMSTVTAIDHTPAKYVVSLFFNFCNMLFNYKSPVQAVPGTKGEVRHTDLANYRLNGCRDPFIENYIQ